MAVESEREGLAQRHPDQVHAGPRALLSYRASAPATPGSPSILGFFVENELGRY